MPAVATTIWEGYQLRAVDMRLSPAERLDLIVHQRFVDGQFTGEIIVYSEAELDRCGDVVVRLRKGDEPRPHDRSIVFVR